jgi:hypothetical protein
VLETHLDVARWQPPGGTFRPFQNTHRVRTQIFGEARPVPFFGFTETIQIKVIEV